MYSTEESYELQLEISTKCTLACSECIRTIHQGQFKIQDMSLELIDKIIAAKQKINVISVCGNYGDPIYHSQFHEVIRRLQTIPNSQLSIATNGSFRSREWWLETAKLLRPKDQIIFGIDGLEDTSLLYRKNSDWNSIMTALETLRDFGRCQISWQWILFKHNEHQFAEAAALTKKLRIKRFSIISSGRYLHEEVPAPTITLEQARKLYKEAYDLSSL